MEKNSNCSSRRLFLKTALASSLAALPTERSVAAALGADIMNVIGVIPLPGTRFEHAKHISPRLLETLRRRAGRFLPQMRHCSRCRADAAGLIGCGHGQELGERGTISPQSAEFPRITDSEATSHECATLCS